MLTNKHNFLSKHNMLMVAFMRTHGKKLKIKNILVLDKKILSKKEEVVIALINNEHNYAVCGVAPGGVAARSSSSSSLIPSFEDCSFHYSCVSPKGRRLRLYAVPCAVRMLYDLGVLALNCL